MICPLFYPFKRQPHKIIRNPNNSKTVSASSAVGLALKGSIRSSVLHWSQNIAARAIIFFTRIFVTLAGLFLYLRLNIFVTLAGLVLYLRLNIFVTLAGLVLHHGHNIFVTLAGLVLYLRLNIFVTLVGLVLYLRLNIFVTLAGLVLHHGHNIFVTLAGLVLYQVETLQSFTKLRSINYFSTTFFSHLHSETYS